MKTYILLLLALTSLNYTLSQTDVIPVVRDYDLLLEETLYGTWYRKIAIYKDGDLDTCYKKYEFYPNNRIIMTEVRDGEVSVYDYCSYFVQDTCLFLVTHFKDTAFITDAVQFNHIDSANFVIKSFYEGQHYEKTTFGIRKSSRKIPENTPLKKDEELIIPGFAERAPLMFS